MRHFLLQAGTVSGEYSPHLYGRSDISQYKNAFALMRNALPLPQGPATKRPGSQFVLACRDETRTPTLIKFIYSVEQAYVLEFGQHYVRFHRNRDTLLSTAAVTNGTFTGNITGWTDLSSGTGTATASANTLLLTSGAGGTNNAKAGQAITYVGIEEYTLTFDVISQSTKVRVGTSSGAADILAATTVAVGTGQTVQFTPTTSGTIYISFENANASTAGAIDNVVLDTPVYTLYSPYTAAEAAELGFDQSADVLFLVHGDHVPRTLSRSGASQWFFTDLEIVDGPYNETNTTSAHTLQPSGTTGSVTITAAGSGNTPFLSTDVGKWIRIQHSSTWGAAQITAYTSSTVVTASVHSFFPFGATTAQSNWRLGQWSTAQGWPQKIAFHEQRLVFARSDTFPDRLWLSESQGWSNTRVFMSPTNTSGQVVDTNGINAPIASSQSNAIEWMSSGNVLAIGTKGSEWVLKAGDISQALTPSNHRVVTATTAGSKPGVLPVRVDGQVLFAQATGYKVQQFQFSFEQDAYLAHDVTIFADHITRPGIIQSAYCSEPFNVAWWLLSDGALAALTYVADQDVGGWSRHTIAGSVGGEDGAVVESIAAIPSEDDDFTELWMAVKRQGPAGTWNGYMNYTDEQYPEHRYIEVLSKPFFDQEQHEARYLDSYVYTESITAFDTVSGLDHLEGEYVRILNDGAVEPLQIVVDGAVTLQRSGNKVVVGLPIYSILRNLSYDTDTHLGTSMGQKKRITEVDLLVHETQGLQVGVSLDKLTMMPDRPPSGLMDHAPALTSDWVRFQFIMGWRRDAQFYIVHDLPVPFTVTAMKLDAVTNEG